MADPVSNSSAGSPSVSSNTVTMPDGTTHVFPPDATPEEITKILGIRNAPGAGRGPTYNFSPVMGSNFSLDSLRPVLAGIAGHFAGAGAATVPGAGPVLAPIADTAAYSGIDYILKMLNPETPAVKQSAGDQAMDSIKDGLINAVAGRVLNGVFRVGAAFRDTGLPDIYKFAPTTSQALESMGFHTLATAGKFAEDFGATGSKAAALDKAGGAGFTQALAFANQLNGRAASTNIDPVKLADKLRESLKAGLVTSPPGSGNLFKPQVHYASEEALSLLNGGSNPFSKLDEVIQDPDRLAKVLKAGQLGGPTGLNVRKDLQAYQFMRMVNDAKSVDPASGAIRLDPNKINNVWTDPNLQNSLDTLYGKQNRQSVSDFIRNVAYTQDKMRSYPIAKGIRFLGAGFGIPAKVLTGDISGALGAGGLATAYIPSAVMGRLLTTPGVSEYVGKLVSGEPLSEGVKYGNRALVNALQGYNIAMIDAAGNKTWGQIGKNKDSDSYQFFPTK